MDQGPYRLQSPWLRDTIARMARGDLDVDFEGRWFADGLLEVLVAEARQLKLRMDNILAAAGGGPRIEPEDRTVEEIESLAAWGASLAVNMLRKRGEYVGSALDIRTLLTDYSRVTDGDIHTTAWINVLDYFADWPERSPRAFYASHLRGKACRSDADESLMATPGNLLCALGFAKLDLCLTRAGTTDCETAMLDLSTAWECALGATELNDQAVRRFSLAEGFKFRNRRLAQLRHAKDGDGKQAAKRSIRELWVEWKTKAPDRYRSNAAFARDMLDKFTVLTSNKVIEGWCTDWSEEK